MVLISDIGEEDDALFCMTEYENCCKNPDGEFYYPDSSKVRIRASGDSLYRNRGDQLIRLNRGMVPSLHGDATDVTYLIQLEKIPVSTSILQVSFGTCAVN